MGQTAKSYVRNTRNLDLNYQEIERVLQNLKIRKQEGDS
jgi:hypothetical protein